jgi:polar amino acid transport system permease protein
VEFDLSLALSIVPLLVSATAVTVKATVAGFAIALVGGAGLLALRRSRLRLVSLAAGFIGEFVRNTPLLVQIYFLYFIAPRYGLTLTPLQTGIVALGLHYSCYLAEVYRAGLESVPAAQWDAAVALNLPHWRTYQRVILPQAILPIIPAAGTFLIYMLKDTPFLAAISATELMFVASKIGTERFQYLEPITLCGLIFLVLSVASAVAIRLVEHQVGRRWRWG